MTIDPWSWTDTELAQIEAVGLRRYRRRRESPPIAGKVQLDGQQLYHFGSNDYLGLASDGRLIDAIRRFVGYHGWGAAASPLVAGHATLHEQLEQRLAEFEGTQAALLFPSGFAANVGTIVGLVGPEDVVFSDALNHASLIDGIRLSRASCQVFAHRDTTTLEQQLAASRDSRRRLIVTDSIFSMDGDAAELSKLAELAERYDALLLVDEAHATGVYGATGRGLHEAAGINTDRLIIVGTLSKALGSSGGFVAGRRSAIELIMHRARTYMFSTAMPEASCAAAMTALEIVREEPQRRIELLLRAAELREQLQQQGWKDLGTSQIIPLRVGSAERAVELSHQLLAAGCYVPAIRPPAVPAAGSLLRISLTSAHRPEAIETLLKALS